MLNTFLLLRYTPQDTSLAFPKTVPPSLRPHSILCLYNHPRILFHSGIPPVVGRPRARTRRPESFLQGLDNRVENRSLLPHKVLNLRSLFEVTEIHTPIYPFLISN